MKFNEHYTPSGECIFYAGSPNLQMLDALAEGPGDIWHSSLDRGWRDAFPEIAYQATVFFWYVRDFKNLHVCPSWRMEPGAFAVRRSVWEQLGGFDDKIGSEDMRALDFAFNALRNQGAVILHVSGLYGPAEVKPKISALDRYQFFARNFKRQHALFMLWRKGLWRVGEWKAFLSASKIPLRTGYPVVKPRPLAPMQGTPSVSYIIPTMSRQDYALTLLRDLAAQTYLPAQVVVVDATPAAERDESVYNPADFPFRLDVIWQTTKGSCRARNEAIAVCKGDYIAFGDDDIRIPRDFIENHIRFLQTNGVEAANGLDVRAHHHTDGLDKLEQQLRDMEPRQKRAGCAQLMSNSNAFVSRRAVESIGGNDINYDGGYGEDNDFGFSIAKTGVLFLQNPYSANLHLKPPAGGYRVWGNQAKKTGKKRKAQPWELDTPVRSIRPVPSPTLMYYYQKHFGPEITREYRHKYFFLYLFKNGWRGILGRIVRFPYRQLQFNRSLFYAKKLMALGPRIK